MRLVNPLCLTAIALKILGAQATVNYLCDDADLLASLQKGVKESLKMAQGAYDTLSQQPLTAWVSSGLLPILNNADLADVITLFERMTNIETAAEIYDFYCDGRFLTYNENLKEWVDATFTYPTAGPDGGVVRRPVTVLTGEKDPNSSPISDSIGYTLCGEYIEADESRGLLKKDYSDQRHIYISAEVLETNSDSVFDQRPVYTIASEGFSKSEGTITIDSIDPPSITIFHELTHAVGGMILNTRRYVISDGPNSDYYEYKGVLEARQAGEPASKIAETLTYVAKIIALSNVRGKPVWWDVGSINAANYLALPK